jgi:PAS domain S-box-containing protein
MGAWSRSSCNRLGQQQVYDARMTATESIRAPRWAMDYGLRPCAIAGSFVLVALLWTFPLQHYTAYPFVFLFLGSIVGSAWFGGLIAGFLATALSYLLITFLFIPPLYSVSVGREFRSYAASYVIFAVVITVVGSARKRAETAIRTARDELETRVQERTVELQHSNQEILGRERQLRLLAEAIPQQIWSADATGCIEYCNHDLIRHIGKNIDELRGEAFYTIFHPEDILPFRDSWEAARKTTGNFEVQARIRGANGAYRWFLVRAVPQRDLDEKVVRWYGVHIDIEEQRRLQQGLLLAQDDLSRFTRTMTMTEMAASIAHQLNQPLTALVTNASACQRWIRSEPANLDKARAAADRIVRDSATAAEVLSRVRSLFSKSDYIRESTDINRLIVDLVRLLRDDAMRRGASIQLRLEENLPNLMLDRVQIQQVLLNLATNGFEAMMNSDLPRVLEICTSRNAADTVAVSMRDRGHGFTEEIQRRLFEPFFTTKPEGTGMGLAICRSIIEAHEGHISATWSEQGTVFEFVLKVDYDEN